MSGLLGKIVTDGSVQLAAVVPPGVTYSLLNILIINPTGAEANVRVYASMNAVPSQIDTLDHRATLPANGGRVEYSCVNCSANEKIFIEGPSGLIVRVTSIDES